MVWWFLLFYVVVKCLYGWVKLQLDGFQDGQYCWGLCVQIQCVVKFQIGVDIVYGVMCFGCFVD